MNKKKKQENKQNSVGKIIKNVFLEAEERQGDRGIKEGERKERGETRGMEKR